jgi:tetratricopeptide (TPR) repeat protein
MPPSNSPYKIVAIVFSVIIFSVVAVGVYVLLSSNSNPFDLSDSGGRGGTTVRSLRTVSDAYKQGDQLVYDQNYQEAIPVLEDALDEVNSFEQEAQVKYKIALAVDKTGDEIKAINLMKEIVANPDYPNLIKAYAVEYIARIEFSGHQDGVYEEMFKGDPYQSFLDPNDSNLSYRRMFDYASSFYPLSLSEARSAYWYAERINHIQNSEPDTPERAETIKKIKDIIRLKFYNIDADVARESKYAPGSSRIVQALEWKAITAGRLFVGGDDSFGNPEQLFGQAFDALGGRDSNDSAFISYQYAAFLANAYGHDRDEDIKRLLDKLYTPDAKTKYKTFYDFIIHEGEHREGEHLNFNPEYHRPSIDLPLVAEHDPRFKEILNDAHWHLE